MKPRFLLGGYRLSRMLGLDPRTTLKTVRHAGTFMRDLRMFRERATTAETQMSFGQLFPCLGEGDSDSGVASGHYFHQDLLVARRVFERGPERHIDIGSRIDGFVAHVASFRKIEVLDIRPLANKVANIEFRQADLMAMSAEYVACTDSASCLHALEHVGLGRYGDELDPDGHLKGLASLTALVKTGGMLYLSVPIGPQRIEFNAHRVFAVDYLLERVRSSFDLVAFSYVDDAGDLHENVTIDDAGGQNSFGCHYGCGIFELRRR
ncbi:MAG: DUF268 domain-containing protein [Myxococcota bacterium]|nr:DUF268 domain-containing protein [Myxococcota bacterium]